VKGGELPAPIAELNVAGDKAADDKASIVETLSGRHDIEIPPEPDRLGWKSQERPNVILG